MTRELKECKEELKEHVRERGETSEQAKQHVSMICALEERMNIAVNKNKEHQAEIGRLLATVTGNMMQQEQRCNFKLLLFIIALVYVTISSGKGGIVAGIVIIVFIIIMSDICCIKKTSYMFC